MKPPPPYLLRHSINRRGKTVNSRENRSSKDIEGTIDESRVHSLAKKKLRIGLWNVCGFATEERRRPEIAEQVMKS